MKNIGILTFHRAHNFGAVLQCYALQSVLTSFEYDCVVLDYRPDYIEKNYRVFSLSKFFRFLSRPRLMVKYIRAIPERKNRKKHFNCFANSFFHLIPYNDNLIPTQLDGVVIGSDQLWSTNYTGGIVRTYFGEVRHEKKQKIIGYAISSNEKSLIGIGDQQLKTFVSNFDVLSFREKTIADLVYSMTGRECQVCVDPVLLTTPSMWDSVVDDSFINEKYVLVYQVHPVGGDFMNAVRYAKQIANQRQCKVVDLTDGHCSPEEFVSRFKYAQFVVTTSFHGTVFSTIFHREFVTLKVNDTVDGRANGLLLQIGMIERMIEMDSLAPLPSIDYDEVDRRLALIRENSLDYLRKLKSL